MKIKILVFFTVLSVISACKQEYVELPQDQRLVYASKASKVEFYDNYANDALNTNLTAVLTIPIAAFNKEEVVMSLHTFNFVLLNEELSKREYAQLSYIGGNINNTFVYFMAQEFKKDFVGAAEKEFDVEFYFKGLSEPGKYFLYRIKIPDFYEKLQNSLKGAKGYSDDDLYYLISGRESADALAESLAKGETNLMNWELVNNAVVERNGEKAVAKFKTKQANYIYCLASHFLPFPIIQNLSIRQQGISILGGDTIVPVNTNSPVENFYYATLQTEPVQEYYYKKLKVGKKDENASLFKFFGVYTSNTVKLPLEILEQVAEIYPNDSIQNIRLLTPTAFELTVDGKIWNFNESGVLLNRQVQSTIIENKINNIYKSDVANQPYDRIKTVLATYGAGASLSYTVATELQTEIILGNDYKLLSIKNPNLAKNETSNIIKIGRFRVGMQFNTGLPYAGPFLQKETLPTVDDPMAVKYYFSTADDIQYIINKDLTNPLALQHHSVIQEIPRGIITDVSYKYNEKVRQIEGFKSRSEGGEEFLTITVGDYKSGNPVLIYKNNGSIEYELADITQLPPKILQTINTNNFLDEIFRVYYYWVDGEWNTAITGGEWGFRKNGRPALEICFSKNPNDF